MVNLIPELKAIIGEQPPVPELPQRDAQRRFHLVFRQLISVFARPEHPLALFLDDLQWLDAATLDLMEDLLTQPDLGHLMLIGAYRDNEVESTHPLLRKLQGMRQAGALLQDIVLAPLTGEDLTQLVADALRCESQAAAPLASLVHDKTRGNPFFVIQFLTALFDEDLLRFHQGSRQCSWDLTRIHAKGYTDNVVSLMVGKLARLAPAKQSALQQLACLGNTAELALLQVVYQDSPQQLHAQLAEAVEEQEQLAKLNLIAARRARASTAYVSALHYLVTGVALLSDDGWGRRPDLMFALEVHRAECEYVTGELSAAEARLGVLAALASSSIR